MKVGDKIEGRLPYVVVNHSPPCWHVQGTGFNAGIASLQDPDPTDSTDLLSASPPLVEGRMGGSNFRFIDKGRLVRKLETAPVSWIWLPCLFNGIGRDILPRLCFGRQWINCSLTENAEQVLCQWELCCSETDRGEKAKALKKQGSAMSLWVSQNYPVFLYLQFSVLFHCQREFVS